MNDYIDIYCERLEPGLFAEPLNAITNLSFIIAAFFAYRLARKEGCVDYANIIMAGLMALIGIGSGLFHTFATKLTMMSDVIPILLYQIAFIWFYARGVIRFSMPKTIGLFAVFVALTAVSGKIPEWVLNGSMMYMPAFMFIFGFGVYHALTKQRDRYVMILAAAVFTVSVTFRSIDMQMCDAVPMGTHFLWHTLNGLVLYLTTRGVIMGRLGVQKSAEN